jgi:hypothetical protein
VVELAEAEPVLKATEDAYPSIKPENMWKIAGYASPSYSIRRIIDGVLILRKLSPYVWAKYDFKNPI